MHTATLTAPVNDKTTSSANYLNAFDSTSTGLYLTPKTEYPILNENVSNGTCYQTNLYPYNQTTFNNTTTNSYDQAAINRRKNATRETTNTLKAWLYEHRKNPYPTKGEKIMLAIITKMTLTQVSTWFANARRRLKKENKMTWSPRNKCNSGSGDEEDDSSDIEYISNENGDPTTVINETEESRIKRTDNKLVDQDEEMINGQSTDDVHSINRVTTINKCDDSDSNTSSNLKQNSPSTYENGYGKETTTNYSITNESNYVNLENHHDRFFTYPHRTTEQLQFPYSSNRITHHPQYHLTYSTSIQIPPVSNLTYAQSQINETASIYNQIHSHHYNVHAQQHPTTPHHNGLVNTTGQTVQSQQQQQSNITATNLVSNQQTVQDSLQHPVYHHVSNGRPNASYSLLQSTYPTADYMLAHHTHQLHQTAAANNQLTQNTLYYPTNSLTQLSSQVQSNPMTNNNSLRNSIVESNQIYPNHLSSIKSTINSLNNSTNSESTKSDENNNLENSNNLDQSQQMNSDNTRKIWSLAQTATDSNAVVASLNQVTTTSPSSNSVSTNSVDTSAGVAYNGLDQTIEQQSQTNSQQQLVKGHSPSAAFQISSYMNSHLVNNGVNSNNSPASLNSSMLTTTNNQLTNYNNALHHHQNYPIDCATGTHNSNTFLGKVFFDYISTGTTSPLEHERNWTRIGLL